MDVLESRPPRGREDAQPSPEGRAAPPRWLVRCLCWALSEDDWGETVAGDLIQEFGTEAAEVGIAVARRRFVRRGLSVLGRAAVDRGSARTRQWVTSTTPLGGGGDMRQWTSDLRIGARGLARTPGFTVVAVLTLAVGIGANTAIFSAVRGVLLEPLGFPDADRLVSVGHSVPGFNFDRIPLAEDTYALIRSEQRVFEGMAAYRSEARVNLTGEGEPRVLHAATVSWDLPQVLRMDFALGRGFTEDEDVPEGPEVAVLSHGLWQEAFGADPTVLGRTIRLDGRPSTIVGVLPRVVDVPDLDADLWLPIRIDLGNPVVGAFGLSSLARLEAGRTTEVAEANLAPIMDILAERMAGAEAYLAFIREGRMATVVSPLKTDIVGDVRAPLWVLLGTVGFVLLIACANVANLILVRAEARQKEIAVRSALGASRWVVVRGFLSESVLLAVAGGILGLSLAAVALPGLLALAPEELPRASGVGIDIAVLLFTSGLVVLTTLLFGVLPAIRAVQPQRFVTLKHARGSTAGRERHRMRNALVAGQTALALVLLIGSGLMLRSFDVLRRVDPGFEPEGALTLTVSLPQSTYETAREAADFHQALTDRLVALPGVQSSGAAEYLPLSGGGSGTVHRAEGIAPPPGELPPVIFYKTVGPGYFEAMGTELVAGRLPERTDHEQQLPNVVINRATAERMWPGLDPLNRRIGPNDGDSVSSWYAVVGVVEDVRDENLIDEARALVYYPMVAPGGGSVGGVRSMTYVLRTAGDPANLAGPARAAVWELDPDLPITAIRELSAVVSEAEARMSFTVVALAVAAGVALVLGAVGLYGILSYVVTQRTREIGVRLALGAQAQGVRTMVMRQGLVVSGVGILAGLLGALALTRVLESLLYGTSPTDPLTFVATTGLLLGVGLLASYLPARRASTVDPIEALRAD